MKEKMLILPMKKKWFDMVLSGEKRQEFREYKPYWTKRIESWERINGEKGRSLNPIENEIVFSKLLPILFVNGYGKNAPRFIGKVDGYSIRSIPRHPEWGESEYAEKLHYAFHVRVIERIN